MKKLGRLLATGFFIALAAATLLFIHLTMPGWYARFWYPLDHQETIISSSRSNSLDPALVAAVIYEESSFDDDNTSHAGAVGLMQLMPDTAQWIASQQATSIEAAQLKDPDTNIAFGCWYIRYLLDRFGDQRMALAAYNAGAENVEKWLATPRAAGRIFDYNYDIPYAETREYITAVEKTQDIYRRAYPQELEAT